MNSKKEMLMGVLLVSMLLLTSLTLPVVRAFDYPPLPHLNVSLGSGVIGGGIGNTFGIDVMLMGEGGVCLDPFWDVGGFDIYVNFDPSILRVTRATADPDGWFSSFWPLGLTPKPNGKVTIDNVAGTVHYYAAGWPGPGGIHTPPFGHGRLLDVRFREIGDSYTPVLEDITLWNPRVFVQRTNLDADTGLIDLTSPVTTQWHAISPDDYGTPYSLDVWEDVDTDSELSIGDELILTDKDSEKWHRYTVYDIKPTLELTHLFTAAVDDLLWMADFPNDGLENNGLPGRTVTGSTGDEFNGFGMPYWTGNFSVIFPVKSVNQIVATCLPFTGDEYTQVLTPGVDYIVHDDENVIELLLPVDVDIINEHWVDGVNNTLNGWPWINYVASGIASVYRKFPEYNEHYGETEGFALNNGYAAGPPGEWWYDPEWPWELEGWWALGYFSGPQAWPDGTEWWIDYTAASYLTVDFNADPDPRPYYVEWCEGTYEEFLAMGDPVCTTWDEVYPNSLTDYHLVDWTDSDLSGDITASDLIVFEDALGNLKTFHVDGLATDIIVDQHMCICDEELTDPFYGMEPIVELAGFAHPEREMCPWHNRAGSLLLPHTTGYLLPTWPTADFTVSPRNPKSTGTEVTFDASGSFDPDGVIVSYEWDFGDGTTATGVTASHAWTQRGFYTTSLKVTDNDGLYGCAQKTMAVHPVTWAKAEHPVYDVSKDEDAYNDLSVKVTNDGTTSVYLTARFLTFDKRTGILLGPAFYATGTATAGTDLELTAGWKPADYGWPGTDSKYTVVVEVFYTDFDGRISAGKAKINFHVVP